MLQLQNVKKQFQNNPILNGINLTIEDGENVSILGLSGSGKTTLLNIILGLTQIDEGSILFAGQDISQTSMKDRGFNIVFQDYALFPNLNAYQNIIYGLKIVQIFQINKKYMEYVVIFVKYKIHLVCQIYRWTVLRVLRTYFEQDI